MADVFSATVEQSAAYFAGSLYPLLFAVCLLIICFHPAAKAERNSLLFPNLLLFVLIFCPLSAFLIMKMIGEEVYWRVFWMLTIPIACSYAIVQLTAGLSKQLFRILTGFLAAAVILVSGQFLFTGDYFSARENNFKLPTEVIYVADRISADASQAGIENPKAVVPEYLSTYIRQYDAGIRLAYGRNMAKGDVKQSKLYLEINSDQPRAKRLARLARKEDCDYLVLPASLSMDRKLAKHAFVRVDEIAGYVIYYDEEKSREGRSEKS